MNDLYNEIFQNQGEEVENVFSSSLFQEYLRTKLTQLFDQIEGKKHLIFDDQVKVALNLTLESSALSKLQVEVISHINNTQPENLSADKIIIFIQPNVEYLDQIKEYLDKENAPKPNQGKKAAANAQQQPKREFYLIYWPKRTTLCKEAQDEKGITDDQIRIIDFSFDLIPIDQDLLSLEMPSSFISMYLDNDFSTYCYVAESIQRLQIIYGKIPNIFLKGDGASIVMDILSADEETKGINQDYSQSEFETMILLDRNIDFITPLCSQLVYEGLIDDFYGINGNLLRISDGALIGLQAGKPVLMKLSSENNTIYSSIRDQQISKSREIVTSSALELQRIKDTIQNYKQNKTQDDLQKCIKIVEKITKDQKHIEDHVNLQCSIVEKMRTIEFYKDLMIEQSTILGVSSSQALEYIEMIIGLGAPLEKALRLLCLQSLVDKGIKPKQFDDIRKEIVHEYGFRHLITMMRLNQIGILNKQDGSKNYWPKLKENLKLVDDEVVIDNPQDPAYAFSGYCPLTVRLVEHALKRQTWKHIAEYIKNVPGKQDFPEPSKYSKLQNKSAILVYFIGGVTYGEISAIRLLSKITKREIVVATTHITNSKKLIQSVMKNDVV
ncbi:vacuolar protein sorting-associated protein (macronuclear) [Tetrahymena thermophila SB210]|uniref:Vacuolar protein sorting-associated protein n=1 Tax=Tetrahymena thermophila (strain SB210) TaxID=312017 RepID=W7XI99_TETTS|nr:vacuolar protein sorting-associated protein [Tetrahymena thermophila SB210]EWS74446.1 vacuolar protein sorting-associated protein [Tetrahymena thermophila SB210]|eukprot:XP_012653023.1 vacuolar protein sorting-associated protein [Tetrahymena thermophila SB210]